MCGIVGAIGVSTNPQVTFDLLTALLLKTEVRGDDATGFWASCREGEGDEKKNRIFFSKEPEKSSLFIKNNWVWQEWKDHPVDLIIAHCRKRTMQNGSETVNVNNHPFLSKNADIALVHNGNVPEFEMLKPDYSVKSDCDSEVLLRVLESGAGYEANYQRNTLAPLNITAEKKISDLAAEEELPFWCSRMMGMRDIFARVNHGALAVAVGEIWPDETRALWLFRNKERPLHVVDLREQLGQVFFVSTPEIWRNAVESVPAAKAIIPQNGHVIEFPEMHVWMISYDLEQKFNNRKWKIVQKRNYSTSFDKERPTKVVANDNEPKAIITTNIDLTTFAVIKPPKQELAVIPDSQPSEDDIPFTLDEVVLSPLVGSNRIYTEDEAKRSFLAGDEWLAEGGARVNVKAFNSTQKIKLRYSQIKPPIDVVIPQALTSAESDSKKNFRLAPHLHLRMGPLSEDHWPVDGADKLAFM